MRLNKKFARAIAICAAAGTLVAGGTFAYLTDYDQAVNKFTIGKVDIDLDEPNWTPTDNTDVTPTMTIKKDPMIKNIGENEAFVYMEVSIPMANVIVADADGKRGEKKNQELFSFKKNSGWTQISAKVVGSSKVYTYVYNKILKPKESTGTLFDTVIFANVIEGQLDTQVLDIPVRAYAIQTTNTGGSETDVVKKATVAFEKYVNQNEGQAGGTTH